MVQAKNGPALAKESKIVYMHATKDLGVQGSNIITKEQKSTCVAHTQEERKIYKEDPTTMLGGPV